MGASEITVALQRRGPRRTKSYGALHSRWFPAFPRVCLALVINVYAVHGNASEVVEAKDSDEDGLSDRLERETGTNPYRRDTDEDGVSDGHEDRDRDGVHDVGESDPRRAGLFPGNYPHIPEPIVFDLVRGLGARRGELEMNTLGLLSLDSGEFRWAPEIEWAFWDGNAIELELPFVGRRLEALKLAMQTTLPSPMNSLVHGVQGFVEVGLDAGATDMVLLYLLGQRLHRKWSYLAMVGGNAHVDEGGRVAPGAIFNASVFFDAIEWNTWGIESNSSWSEASVWAIRLFPQTHVQVSRRFRIQLAGGVEFHPGAPIPMGAVRLILE